MSHRPTLGRLSCAQIVMVNAKSHEIACDCANRRQCPRGCVRVERERPSGLPMRGMVPQGPEEAATVGDHGAQHLQVTQQIGMNWGNTEL